MNKSLKYFSVLFVLIISFITISIVKGNKKYYDGKINLISREAGSGTRDSFVDLFNIREHSNNILKDNTSLEAIITNKTNVAIMNVSNDINSIGYASLGSLSDNVKILKIDDVFPSSSTIASKEYKIFRPFLLVYDLTPNELTLDFLDYILSSDGQKIMGEDYISLNKETQPYVKKDLSGKLVISGSSSVFPIVEKLAEEYQDINSNIDIEIQTTDSTSGITSVLENSVDIGMVSRDLKEEEIKLLNHSEIGYDGLGIIVNKNNPIDNLSSENIKKIFTREIDNWKNIK